MHVRELGHIVLSVRNLEASAHFYGDVLGLRKVTTMGGRSVFYAGEGGRTHHELLLTQSDDPNAERGKIGLSHFAFKVGTTDDELRAALDELKESGVQIERIVDHGGVTHSVYMKDPDGNTVEVYIDVQPEAWRYDPTKTVGQGAKPLSLV
jgi:catechol 2,3-dioxygenase